MIYNPIRFQSKDFEKAFDLMDRNPFATLISTTETEPFVSHLPLTPKRMGDQIEILGHLAKANPHWELMRGTRITVIFHGAHTYVTPMWYTKPGVPTWNYSVVHVCGQIELIEDFDGIIQCLKELSGHAERHWPSGWKFETPDELGNPEYLTRRIAGFRIKVEKLDFKQKLSQNQTPVDRLGALAGLATRADDQSRQVLADMKKMDSN